MYFGGVEEEEEKLERECIALQKKKREKKELSQIPRRFTVC